MAAYSGEVFAASAYAAGIPAKTVAKKCCNRGLTYERACELAEDAAADAYYRSLKHCFQSEDHYLAWVTATAVNIAIDKLRHECRSRSKLEFLARKAFLTNGAAQQDPAVAALVDGVASLPEDERNVLWWTYKDNLTLDDIANRTLASEAGTPNSKRLRVKRKRDRAENKLRAYLAQHGYRPNKRVPNSGVPLTSPEPE